MGKFGKCFSFEESDPVGSRDLQGIFEPIFQAIDKLIAEQVMQVRLKRMKDQHPKGFEIKV